MPRDVELRIETPHSHDATDLIDDLRAHGLEAELADTPGTWDVEVTGPLWIVARILAEQLADHGTAAAAVHAGAHLYVVSAAAAHEREGIPA